MNKLLKVRAFNPKVGKFVSARLEQLENGRIVDDRGLDLEWHLGLKDRDGKEIYHYHVNEALCVSVDDYIHTHHGGNKSAFARDRVTTRQAVHQWIEAECVVYNDVVYAPKKLSKPIAMGET